MATTKTAPIPVTVLLNTAARITFHVTLPSSPLWLGTLTVTPQAPGPGGIGTAQPGTQAAPATHLFSMGSAEFSTIRNVIAASPTGLSLQITYDTTTYAASDCVCSGTAPRAVAPNSGSSGSSTTV